MAQVNSENISLDQHTPRIEGGTKCSRNSMEGVRIDKHHFICYIFMAKCYIFIKLKAYILSEIISKHIFSRKGYSTTVGYAVGDSTDPFLIWPSLG